MKVISEFILILLGVMMIVLITLFDSGMYLPCFLVTFVLGKVSYNLLYRHLIKGCA